MKNKEYKEIVLRRGPGDPWVAQEIPGWLSGLVPAFGPGHDPGVLGSGPMSGSRHGASSHVGFPAWSLLLPLPVSLPLSLSLSLCVCVSHEQISKLQKIE